MRRLGLDESESPPRQLSQFKSAANRYKFNAALRKETEDKAGGWSDAWLSQTLADFQILFREADYIDDRPQAAELKAAKSQHARW